MDRRAALRASVALLAGGCLTLTGNSEDDVAGRLTRRQGSPANRLPPGTTALGLGAGRDGWIHVPPHGESDPLPLLLLLHGAGGQGADLLERMRLHADERRVVLLAPDSRATTWDIFEGGGFSWDVAFIDRALAYAFANCRIDAARTGTAGFSDGGTYALSLGIINGDFLTHAAAFAPGSIAGEARRGRPRVFITHGKADRILPIERTSRLIVPWLVDHGYTVAYHEHEGGHTVSPAGVDLMFSWFLG